MDPIIDAIDVALKRTGLSDAAASKLAVGNYSLIKNMRADRGEDKRYSYQSLEQLARVLGLECYFGPKRFAKGFSEGESVAEFEHRGTLSAGYLPIPWHRDQGARSAPPVVLHPTWLASNGLIPDYLQAVQPSISHLLFAESKNTVAVMQTNAPQRGNGGIWCYKDAASIGIARCAFSDGLAILLPGSETDDARIISKDSAPSVRLLGKVVWLGLLT